MGKTCFETSIHRRQHTPQRPRCGTRSRLTGTYQQRLAGQANWHPGRGHRLNGKCSCDVAANNAQWLCCRSETQARTLYTNIQRSFCVTYGAAIRRPGDDGPPEAGLCSARGGVALLCCPLGEGGFTMGWVLSIGSVANQCYAALHFVCAGHAATDKVLCWRTKLAHGVMQSRRFYH